MLATTRAAAALIRQRVGFRVLSSGSHPDFAPRTKQPPASASAPAGLPESTHQRIAQLVKAKPVVLFMKGSPAQPQCGFSAQVVRILHQHGACRAYVWAWRNRGLGLRSRDVTASLPL